MSKKEHRKGKAPAAAAPGCDCAALEEWAVLFVDGELKPEQRRELLIHIQSCYHCAHLVRSLKRTVHFCHLETGWEVPEQAHRRLWERLERVIKTGSRAEPHSEYRRRSE
jgi:anti-sigma factor RsiW